jgi:hypothetical protein
MLREIAVFIVGVISGAVAALWVADHMLTRGSHAHPRKSCRRQSGSRTGRVAGAQAVTDEIQ